MGLIRDSLAAVTWGETTNLSNPVAWLLDTGFAGTKTVSGETVTPERATSIPTYFACSRVLKEDVSKPPMHVFKKTIGGGREEVPDHPVAKLMRRPNPDTKYQQFNEALTEWGAVWGGGFAEIVSRGNGEVAELWPIHPCFVSIERDDADNLFYKVRDQKTGRTNDFTPDEIFHLPGLSMNGVSGYSVAKVMRESIGLAMALQNFGSAYFGNGGHLGSIFETEQPWQKEAIDRFIKQWEESYTTAQNANGFAVLPYGMRYKPLSMPPEDAQFLQSKQFQVEEMCRAWRIDPWKVHHSVGSKTYANVESSNIDHVDNLMSWILRWEGECNAKLFKESERDTFYVKINLNALLRADSVSRATFYDFRLKQGATINQLNALEDMPPIGPNGDVSFIASGLQPIERAVNPPDPARRRQDGVPFSGNSNNENPREPKSVNIAAILVTHTSRLAAELKRAYSKEANAVKTALKKAKGNRESFMASVHEFYGKFRDDLYAAIETAIVDYALVANAANYATAITVEFCASRARRIGDETIVSRVASLGEAFDNSTVNGSYVSDVADRWIETVSAQASTVMKEFHDSILIKEAA